jgi:gamma-glutamyltranspeptidase/glutathione hydrolase
MATKSSWTLGRTISTGTRGMTAAKTPQAAEAGAKVLERGGNAVDAAVTTAAVAWVAEPWMNGPGGGGYMIVHTPDGRDAVIEFPMVAAKAADPGMFELAKTTKDSELFGWASVVDNANIVGPRSTAVPGSGAGLAKALELFGTITLAQALEPAIALAEEGMPVTWHWSLEVGRDLGNLQKYPGTKAIFLNAQGNPHFSDNVRNPQRVRNPDLARTLKAISDQGIGAFYGGENAATIVGYLNEHGALFTADDFSSYQATVVEPLRTNFHGHELLTLRDATGGATLTESMRLLAPFDIKASGHNSPETLHLLAEAFKIAFADRFTYLADPAQVDTPFEALLSDAYLDERRNGIKTDAASPARAGNRSTLGVTHDLAPSMPEYTSGGSTTHLGAFDDSGMAVTLTQTLLSLWGSRVVVPGTGVMMNNGMMWFDPEPGRPNSIGKGGKRPLSNMCPALVLKDGQAFASLGASGGRKIINCVAQLTMNLVDHGFEMQEATSAPRIDASTPELIVSERIDASTMDQLRALGHKIVISEETLLPGDFASPANIQRVADGSFRGGVDQFYFPATAVGVE